MVGKSLQANLNFCKLLRRIKFKMNNKILLKSFLTSLIFCLLFGIGQTFAQSQASTGQITGVVRDSTNAVIPNATVTATNKNTGEGRIATTNEDGVYQFVLLRPGTYTVTASGSGFAEQTREAVINVGRTVDVDFALGIGDVSAVVNVTGEEVQTTVSQPDSVLDNTEISNLPLNGRRFQDLATLTPNVEIDPQRGQLSVGGQKGIDLAINVDGGDFTQPFFGGIRGGERSNFSFTLPQEAVGEFQVVSAGYSPEFGRSTGGVINVATKGGTNQFSGSAFYNVRANSLARTNAFVDELIASADLVDPEVAPTRHQFGGSFGGPIVRDKFFFFGSYEQQFLEVRRIATDSDLSDSSIISPTVPLRPEEQAVLDFFNSIEEDFIQTNDVYAGSIRFDANFNSKNNANFRFNFSRNDAENAVNTGETDIDPRTDNAVSNDGIEGDRTYTYVGQWTSFINQTFTNEFRGQYTREERPRLSNSLIPNVESNLIDFGQRSFLPTTQFDERLQFSNNVLAIWGDHTAKFGVDYQRIHADQKFGFAQNGQFFIFPTSGTSESGRVPGYFIGGDRNILTAMSTLRIIDPVNRSRSYFGRFDDSRSDFDGYSKQIGNLEAAFTMHELALFAQDSWRVVPNFTINYGVRLSKQFNPSPELGNDALINVIQGTYFPLINGTVDPTTIPDSPWQWGPRLGFAWDINNNGKSVIRGYGGMFYSRTPLLLLAGAFNNYRTTPGDLTATFVRFTGFSAAQQAAFDAANPQYTAIVGNGVAPNTLYRLFAVAGIDLNTFPLNNLPVLTPEQLGAVNQALIDAGGASPSSLGNFTGSRPFVIADDYKNPTSIQFGVGYEREIGKNFFMGFDFANIRTYNRQINLNINLVPPFGVTGQSQRPTFTPPPGQNNRVIDDLGDITLRTSVGKALYQSFTVRTRYQNSWMRFQASYVLSRNLSDDDNERSATGFNYANAYNRVPEYYYSNIDRRHRFTASPIFFLPYGFEVSSAMRLRSGTPVDSVLFNNDVNGDGNRFTDRPYASQGFPFRRNAFRNRPIYDVDVRVQKGFNFDERKRLILTAEFFNVFNLSNIQYAGRTTNYCSSSTLNESCGLNGVTNPIFLQIRDSDGDFILDNNAGTPVFQTQLGVRFEF